MVGEPQGKPLRTIPSNSNKTMKKKLMNLEEKLYRMERKIDEAPLVRVVIIAIAILAIVEAYLIL